MQENKQMVWLGGLVIIVLVVLAFVHFNKIEAPAVNTVGTTTVSTSTVATSSASTTVSVADSPLDTFAKCVAGKGLTMYGAAWCSHCAAEKKAFGSSFKYIKYVECPDNVKLCTDLGINGYPTWIDALGKKYEGEQGLKGVAKITGCVLPK